MAANDDDQNRTLYESLAMTIRDPPAVIAVQYLMWALEYIEKTGDLNAAHHARLAWKRCANAPLRQVILASTHPSRLMGGAKRLRRPPMYCVMDEHS